MAKASSASCIVLKHTKLAETDVIVTLLAEDGSQVRAVAKGLRKPGNRIGARLELFAEARLLLHEGKSLHTVREVRTVRTNAAIREDIERTACASVAAELIEKLGRDGALLGERMYAMSSAVFVSLGEVPVRQTALITSAFIFKAMAMQGFAPAVRECALCGEPIGELSAFDVGYGGALCDRCQARLKMQSSVSPQMGLWVDSLVRCTFAELSGIEGYPACELLDLAHRWVHEHAGLELRSMAFLKGLLV